MVEKEQYDVVIIGAGVAGNTAGKLLANKGHSVLILEEHREIGRPLQCAGLVTPRIFDTSPDYGCILNEVCGAKIYSPSGSEMVIDAGKPKGLVIDRVKFDQGLAADAIRAGCELLLGVKCVNAKYDDDKVKLKVIQDGRQFEIRTRLLIGANGVQSQVSRWFGLKSSKFILSGFGAELTGVDMDPRFVEIYLGSKVAPNFFTWVIPKSRTRTNGFVPARAGLICTKTTDSAYTYYQGLYNHKILGPKLRNAQPVQHLAGGVPIGMVPKSYTDRVMLVGDSAGQVKPTSGGGIYTSIICAKLCAETASVALEKNDCSAKALKSYQKAWLNELGKEFKHGMRLHLVFMQLRDDQLEEGFKLLKDPEILNLISKKGDIDYPSKITKLLFKKVPKLLKFARPYLRSFF
jgi:geranylgeranyl reductase family protein